jgi:hypothetical protein
MDKDKNIKLRFHELIEGFENEDILKDVYSILYNIKYPNNTDILDELNEEQKNRVQESLEQYYTGQVISHKEMKEKINLWLKK